MNSVYVRTKLDPEVKTKWLAALRSGAYTQGDTFLKKLGPNNVFNYCCLGVLGELIEPEAFSKKRFENETDENFSERPFAWHGSTCLPEAWHYKLDYEVISRLACMNDGTGEADRSYSFAEIANWIEENL